MNTPTPKTIKEVLRLYGNFKDDYWSEPGFDPEWHEHLNEDQALNQIEMIIKGIIGENEDTLCDCGADTCGEFIYSNGRNELRKEQRKKLLDQLIKERV